MSLRVVRSVAAVTDLASYDSTSGSSASDILLVNNTKRTSGNPFSWKASGTANGGTVYAGLTGVWEMMYNGPVNVMWFGAIGDGIVDDTTAIQNAINTIPVGGAGSIYFPVGTFKITQPLTTGERNINFTGACMGGITLPATGLFSTSIIKNTAASEAFKIECSIGGNMSDLCIQCTDSAGIGIKFDSPQTYIPASYITNYGMSNCYIRGWVNLVPELVFR